MQLCLAVLLTVLADEMPTCTFSKFYTALHNKMWLTVLELKVTWIDWHVLSLFCRIWVPSSAAIFALRSSSTPAQMRWGPSRMSLTHQCLGRNAHSLTPVVHTKCTMTDFRQFGANAFCECIYLSRTGGSLQPCLPRPQPFRNSRGKVWLPEAVWSYKGLCV